ncbi:MAG TPA: hypothetical protein VL326_07640, partial [Kofleriaceae bacterium]|nr:hypothetical protein [Kofleriaceae bacterium]
PAVNDVELSHVGNMSASLSSVIALGVMPILSAFVLVEVVALAVPRLRWRRHDAKGRIRLRQAVAVLALLFALVKGYFFARYLEHASMYGAEIAARPGRGFELLTMVTLAAGTMLLATLAGIISVHGLANGYAVLLVSDWLLDAARPLLSEDHAFPAYFDRTRLFGIATLGVMMLLAWFALRWRIRGAGRELELRLPSSSVSPVADAASIPALVAALATIGVTGVRWLDAIRGSMLLSAAIVIVFAVWWSWLFARPTLLERAAMQAGFAPPSRAAWWRATLVSCGLLVAVALLGLLALGTDYWNNNLRGLPYTNRYLHASMIADPAMALIATAVLLDMVAGARAHRERLVPVAELHQIQRAAIAERVLSAASIRCYIHAANVRTLLAFFGPWAPAVVMVPEASARDAADKLDGALREPRATLPPARVEAA